MKLDYVVPNMAETFGTLYFGCERDTQTRYVNRVSRVVSRTYELFSSKQRKEPIQVILPAAAGEKNFVFDEDVVRLINPRIVAVGKAINSKAIALFSLYADDMVKVN